MLLILIALLLGIVAGLRTFTAPAVYFLHRGGIAGFILAVCAIGEYVGDMLPKTPPRTHPVGLIFRLLSGGIVGWFVAGIPGAIAGAVGSLVGTFGGLTLRMKAIEAIGAVPAALLEDAIAIGLAILAVTW